MSALAIETWTWYGVATLILVLRMISRITHFGSVLKLKMEDLLMLFAWGFYTAEIYFMNVVSNEESNLLPPGYLQNHQLTSKEIQERAYGSKITLVIEQCQCCCIWLLKTCIILMYYRLTRHSYPKHNFAVLALAAYIGLGFVIMEILYFGVWCRPFQDYWAVPTPNPKQCAAAWNHLITNLALNISSDLSILIIALSIVAMSHFPKLKKAGLCVLCSLGAFVIASALANKIYSFENPYGSEWTFWYIRECSTAMIISNLPYVWSMFRRLAGFDTEGTRAQSVSASLRRQTSSWGSKILRVTHRDTSNTPSTEPKSPGMASQLESGRPRKQKSILGREDALALEGLDSWEMPVDSPSSLTELAKDEEEHDYHDQAAFETSPYSYNSHPFTDRPITSRQATGGSIEPLSPPPRTYSLPKKYNDLDDT